MNRLTGLLGIAVFVALGWMFSRERKAIHWRTIAWGLALQWIFAVIVLKGELVARALAFLPFPKGAGWGVAALVLSPALAGRFTVLDRGWLNRAVFAVVLLGALRGNLAGAALDALRAGVASLMACANAGAVFVFGALAGPSPGMIFAFAVLPTLIFVASIFAMLYHLGVMQRVIGGCARTISRFLKVSGAESVAVAASIFMGQAEAPLTIRPFLARLTRSELMVVMTAGMAHVSGAIMVAYVQVARVDVAHLLTAVIMTAPGAIMMARLLEPETEEPVTGADLAAAPPAADANLLDAAARGAAEGMRLALNVAAMLVAFIALVALVNGVLGALRPALSLERMLGMVFRPFALLMGVPWADAGQVGALLGKRMVVNEMVAFIDLGRMSGLGAKARLIATFALCGFANVSSIAIQVGGIGALVPERRGDLARLGVKAMLAGTMANAVSACIAGILG